MKISISLLFSIFVLSTYGQTLNDTIWYTHEWKRTTYSKIKAIYGIKDYNEEGRGMATYYYKNGTLHSHQNELNDLKDGFCTWYHSNGKIWTEANYINDTVNGEMRTYNEKEQLEYVYQYDMGKIVKRVQYNLETGEPINPEEEILSFPDFEAEFNGGAAALQLWISQNVQYPKEAIMLNEQGRVYLSFVIEVNGEISTINVERGVSESLDEEAIRVVTSMPPWIPGEANGVKVRTRVRLPINFTITNGRENRKNKRNN